VCAGRGGTKETGGVNIIFLTNDPVQINCVYSADLQERLGNPAIMTSEMLGETMPQVEYIFSTWGMPGMSEDEIEACFPNLKAVFYGAGSVQHFARAFINRGVRMFSAWMANGVPVAEFIVAQIVLANKGYFQTIAMMKQQMYEPGRAFSRSLPGNFGATVGLIGCGMIGSLVAKMLRVYDFEVLACDPFLSDKKALELGVAKCDLEEIFSRCNVVSNHLPDKEHTKSLLNYNLFKRMKPNATFINTGRGAQVVEADLTRAMEEEPARMALLDVTEPEPPKAESPLYRLPNVILSPHIAGSMGGETARMGQFMLGEYEALLHGRAAKYEVTREMLETMA
jgi:phosphoglycerate dehydrogenase-like enzyme